MSGHDDPFSTVGLWLQYVLREAGPDGTGYLAVTDFAADTPWLQPVMLTYTRFGVAMFGVLALAAWWTSRSRSPRLMAAALAVPVCAAGAYLIGAAAKHSVQEARPCRSFAGAFRLEACPAPGDYAFPSNHTMVAVAVAVALFGVDRRLGAAAAAATAVMSFSRVYVGVHYPGDVLFALWFGGSITLVAAPALAWLLTPLVTRLRRSMLQPLLGAPASAETSAGPP